jgi:CheY-like chemotaxis protein
MKNKKWNLLLADDDPDDCIFFREALDDLPLSLTLNIANDGAELMELLNEELIVSPDLLFLDLNMPRKNGFECLSEIKSSSKLRDLPVIIFSTSFDQEAIKLLYENGAHYYIRKPGEFSKLRKVILDALTAVDDNGSDQPAKDQFVIQP